MNRTGADMVLRHGYTLDDVQQCARVAVGRLRTGGITGGDRADYYDTAWEGICLLLYSAADPPTERDLITEGWQAIYRTIQDNQRHHGRQRGGHVDDHPAPRFATYWAAGTAHFPEETICERLALPRVLAVLTAPQREVLSAVAALGAQAAAENLDIPYGTLQSRLHAARCVIRRCWFDWETPPASDPVGQCRQGHSRAEHGFITSQGVRDCRRCRRLRKRRGRLAGSRAAA